jgi:hypothetical protein
MGRERRGENREGGREGERERERERESNGSWLVGGVDVRNQKENRWCG